MTNSATFIKRKRKAVGLLATVAFLLFIPAVGVATESSEFGPPLDEIELHFLELINEYRESYGLPCLIPSPTMNAAADYMSRSMGQLGFFSHREPPCDESGSNCTGRGPFERINAFGHLRYNSAGENIAAGNPSAQGAFQGWKDSPGHNANMLGNSFLSIGIARVKVPNSPFGVYWTTNFSDLVDGGGNCSEEGPNDYPAATPGDKELNAERSSACSSVLGPPWLALFLWLSAMKRRRLGRAA